MKVIIEKKEFKNEFGYYEDVLGCKDKKIVGIKFWDGDIEVFPEEIEIIIDEKDKCDVKEEEDKCDVKEEEDKCDVKEEKYKCDVKEPEWFNELEN